MRFLCRWIGHRWITPLLHVRRYYACSRCGEPGFWIETPTDDEELVEPLGPRALALAKKNCGYDTEEDQ